MEITWLGTAGFLIRAHQTEFAFDPFLSRGKGLPSPFTFNDFKNTEMILLGHGHFDHAFDVPEILKHNEAKVYAPGLTGLLLNLRGVSKNQLNITDNKDFIKKEIKLRAFKSKHINFDRKLVLDTLHRCGIKGCLGMCSRGLLYPKGLVQTYYFEINNKKFLFMSSAGASAQELIEYQKLEIDYFMVPLQGHSEIQKIAAEITNIITPKAVIPHHHDDFYPPLSQNISLELFQEELKKLNCSAKVIEIPIFKKISLN